MFSYNVSKNADKKAFDTICSSIEHALNIEKKEKCLKDVDGSLIQIYKTADGQIKVYNDFEIDAVYVDSEVNLDEII